MKIFDWIVSFFRDKFGINGEDVKPAVEEVAQTPKICDVEEKKEADKEVVAKMEKTQENEKERDFKSSDVLIDNIKKFEGFAGTAYRCPAGVLTIGYGHTGRDVNVGDRITKEYATDLLKEDLLRFESYVNKLGVAKTQGQFDALVDFCFNLGNGRLASSTLLKKIKAGASESDIIAEFLRWNKAGGKVLAGLTKRRQWEAKRYFE